MCRWLGLKLYWSLITLGVGVSGRQINPVSVLLPYTRPTHPDHRVNVTLQAFGGCYHWRVQRPNVVKIRDPLQDEWSSDLEDEDKVIFARGADPRPGETVGGGNHECHNTVVVAQYWNTLKAPNREKSWVFADDAESGIGVKCEVYVAPISSFVIETTAKSLTVGGAETLRIRAFDKEGNVFTSLEGLRFEWEIGESKVVQIASLKNDVYRPSATRRLIHEKGEQSDIILLKGLNSGRTSVRARLLEPGYEDVAPASVLLDIIEPIVAVPSTLYVMPYSQLTLGVKVLRGRDTPSMTSTVKLPNADFTWRVSDPTLMDIHPRTAKALVGEHLGEVSVTVSDQRNENNTDITSILVKPPQSMKLHQAPLSELLMWRNLNMSSPIEREQLQTRLEVLYDAQFNPVALPPNSGGILQHIRAFPDNQKNTWYLPKGRPVLFAADVQSSEGESLYLPSNAHLLVYSNTSSQIAELEWISQNQAMGVLLPIRKGAGSLMAKFEAIKSPSSSTSKGVYIPPTRVSTVQRFVVVDPVQIEEFPPMRLVNGSFISPLPIVLPLNYEAHFKLLGGSGNYRLSSSDESICSISNVVNGTSLVVRTTSVPGISILTITDESNEANYYRLHCLSSPIDTISLESSGKIRQYPLSLGTSHVKIPLRATAKLPPGVAYLKDEWLPRRREDIVNDADLAIYEKCHRDPLHFTLCHSFGVDIRAAAASTDIHAEFQWHPQPKMYECGYVQVSVPEDRVISQVAAHVAESSIADSTTVEFYHPISTYIAQRNYFDQLGVSKLQSLAPAKAIDLSSNRIAESVALAVGSTLTVFLIGGPTRKPGCQREIVALPADSDILSLRKFSSPASALESIPHVIQDGEFRITCLRETTVTEIEFMVKTQCDGGLEERALNTKLYVGCSLPTTLHLAPDDIDMSYKVKLLSPLRRAGKDSLHSIEKSKIAPVTEEQYASSKIFAVCGKKHKLQMVALDSYRRPLLAIDSFNPEWQLFANKASVKNSIGRVIEGGDSISLDVPSNYCNADLVVEALLSFKEFSVPSSLSKAESTALRSTSAEVYEKLAGFKTVKDRRILTSLMEVQLSPQPKFIPSDIAQDTLIDNPEWAYRLMAQYGSGNGRYFVTATSGSRTSSVPSIVSINHHTQCTQLPELDGKRVITKSWNRIMNLVTPDDIEFKSDVFDAPVFTRYYNEITLDDLLIKSDGAGDFDIHLEDLSLLGGESASLRLKFQKLGALDLALAASDIASPSLVASKMQGTVTELEAGATYRVDVILQDKKRQPFSPRIRVSTSDKIVDVISSRLDTKVQEKDGQLLFTPERIGKLSIRAEAVRERFLSSPPLELLVHQPLKVSPQKLILLPGGHTWEVVTQGGGSNARNLKLVSDDVNVCDIVPDTDAKVIKSGTKGSTTLKLQDTAAAPSHGSSQLAGTSNGTTLSVLVAYPSYVGFIRDGFVQSTTNGMVSLTAGRPSRLLGALFTADNQPFTVGHLLMPSGFVGVEDTYACRYTWTTENQKILTFLQDESNERSLDSNMGPDNWASSNDDTNEGSSSALSGDIRFTMFPKKTPRISGNGKVAVTLLPQSSGSTRVSLTAECLDRYHWGAPFTRWSDTAHISIFVSSGDDGLTVDEEIQNKHQRIPVLEVQENRYLSVLPGLQRGADESAISICGEESWSAHGDVYRVLLGTQYRLKPRWSDSWNYQVYCDSEDGYLRHADPANVVMCKQPSNYRIEKSQDALIADVPNSPGASVLIVFFSPNRQKMIYVPLVATHPDELQLVAVTSLNDHRMPLPTVSTASAPLKMQVGDRRSVRVLLKKHQRPIIPDTTLSLNIVVSHQSILDITRDMSQSSILHLTANKAGCASLTVSMESYSFVLDTILVCVASPQGTNAGRLALISSEPDKTSIIADDSLMSQVLNWAKYVAEPWLVIRHAQWLILFLFTLAVGAFVIIVFIKSHDAFQVPEVVAPKPTYVSNWATSATPTRPTPRIHAFPTGATSVHTNRHSRE